MNNLILLAFDSENPTLGWSIVILVAIFLTYFGGISLISQLIFRYRESRKMTIFWAIGFIFFVIAYLLC